MKGIDGHKIDTDMMNGRGLFDIQMNIFKGLKFGIIDPKERSRCTDDILKSYDATLSLIVDLGAELDVFTSPIAYDDMAQFNGAITMYEGYRNHRHLYDDPSKSMDQKCQKAYVSWSKI